MPSFAFLPRVFRFRWWAVFLLLAVASPTAAEKNKPVQQILTVDDLYRFDAPTALTLSPDGKRAAYVRQWINASARTERHSLWLVEGNRTKARALEENEPDARAPVFSPDGRWIAFLSTRPRPEGWKGTPVVPPESDPATDVWLIPTSGGKAIPLAGPGKPYGRVFNDGFYGRVSFSRDGNRLVFVADDGKDPRTAEEVRNDVEIVRPDQGEGYTGYRPAQVWVAHIKEERGRFAADRIERLTEDEHWYGDPQWSPDGRTVVVHANRTNETESVRFSINRNFDLWAIEVESRRIRQLTKGEGPEVSPRFSPDGKRLVCLSIPRRGSHRDLFNLAIVNLDADEPKTTILFNHHGENAGLPPHRAPAFPLPLECWELENHLIYNTEAGTARKVVRLDLKSGKGEPLALEAMRDDPEKEPQTAVERMLRRQELTPLGNLFLKERELGPSRVVKWKGDRNLELEGILTTPPPLAKKQAPYKIVVYPHGGPHSRSALGFDFTVQLLAANGYAVFQPNFRVSSGYDQKFIDADRFDFGGGDMHDVLAGLDELIRQGVADKDRQFVYGVSYGGFLTCWMVGQTNRFKAAVAQNAVTDLTMMWSLSDLQSWTEWEFGGRPWQTPDRMRQHSPLTYADRVKTPTLILHAREDRRCPLPMGRAFHQALLANKTATQMVIYPGEGHGIRQPRHREDVLKRILDWFARYDKP
jgi:dipeptidyl aminopeptidase/acylaminoacyl peptidase